VGTGWLCPTKGTEAGPSLRRGGTDAAPARPAVVVAGDPSAAAAWRVAWSSPNFLRNLYRAMPETRTPTVRSTKSIRSARRASGWRKRNAAMGPA